MASRQQRCLALNMTTTMALPRMGEDVRRGGRDCIDISTVFPDIFFCDCKWNPFSVSNKFWQCVCMAHTAVQAAGCRPQADDDGFLSQLVTTTATPALFLASEQDRDFSI